MFNFFNKNSENKEQKSESTPEKTTRETPSIEFFEGISEELSDVSLRVNKNTGLRNVLMTFDNLKALTIMNTFTKRYAGSLKLIDTEGEIAIQPSSCKFLFGGDEGDELKKVECSFEIQQEDHWERFMRFMHRYAEANGLEYGEK